MASKTLVERNQSNEIKLTRVYDAPVSAVWNAWMEPDEIAKWWGPRGFTLTTKSKDVRVGGKWIYTMHGPDGKDWPNITVYHEVEKHKKLVYDHGATETTPPLFRVTVLFSQEHGKTKLEMTMRLPTAEEAAKTRAFIKQAGGNATWDRLAEFLEEKTSGKEMFVINRSFDAPLDVLFDMWTKPEHFSKWLPPTGFTMEFIKADLREGGTSTYMMTNGQFKMYGRVSYLKIQKPELIYTQQFIDEAGNISRHPALKTWPETMHTTVLFSAEGEDQTRVTVTWRPHGPVTAEELAMFVQIRSSITMGWTGSFDKLEALLEAM